MKTFLEQELSKDASIFWDETLSAQVGFSGAVELPFLLDEIQRSNPTHVLDVGTGNGAFLIRIAKEFPKIKFIGIDHNATLLDCCRKNISQSGVKNIEIRECFFSDEGTVEKHDFIIERYTLGHASDVTNFCKGVLRSLYPGGKFISFEGSFTITLSLASGIWKEVMEKYFEVFARWGTQTDSGLSTSQTLTDLGFKNVSSSIRLATPQIAGDIAFKSATLKTMIMFHKQFPDVVSADFIDRVDRELLEYNDYKFPPCIANVQNVAKAPG